MRPKRFREDLAPNHPRAAPLLSNLKLTLFRVSSSRRAVDSSCSFRNKAERRFGVLRLSEINADNAVFANGGSIAGVESHHLRRESWERAPFRHKRDTIVHRRSSSKIERNSLNEFWLFWLLLNQKFTQKLGSFNEYSSSTTLRPSMAAMHQDPMRDIYDFEFGSFF